MEGAAIPPRWCLTGGRGHGAPTSGGKGAARAARFTTAKQQQRQTVTRNGNSDSTAGPSWGATLKGARQHRQPRAGPDFPQFWLQKEFAAREQHCFSSITKVKPSSCQRKQSHKRNTTICRVSEEIISTLPAYGYPCPTLNSSILLADAASSPSPPPSATWVFAPGPGPTCPGRATTKPGTGPHA